jgi:FtsP/CotA-like multicopper oxidase with cupredoxin domain
VDPQGERSSRRGRTIRNALFPFTRRGILTLAAAGTLGLTRQRPLAAAGSEPRILRAAPSGYDGLIPGPALQVRRGEEVWVRLVNGLAEPTALHWHGVRLANAMDGAPPITQAPVAPGESFDYRFVPPDAGTYWYHPPRPMPHGLYGALIVTEAEPIDIDRDVTLIFDQATGAGPDAVPITVNGVSKFEIRAQRNERLRLRLLNASASGILALHIEGLRTFMMATDGEPAEPFAARGGRLALGPGNRIDVFVDCTLDPGTSTAVVADFADGPIPIARIICKDEPANRPTPRQDPQPLPPNPLPERMDFVGALRFGGAIGKDPTKDAKNNSPLFSVKRGRTAVIAFSNPTGENCFIHLHGHHFRLLDALDDGWKPFWLDTLPIAPQSDCRIAFVADNPGKWLIEGLANDGAAEAWFEVT